MTTRGGEPVLVGQLVPSVSLQAYHCTACDRDFAGPALRAPLPEPVDLPSCEVCRAERQAQWDEARRQEERVERRDRLLVQLDVPALFADARFDTFHLHGSSSDRTTLLHAQRRAWEWVNLWPSIHAVQAWVGGPGTGKNHLLYAIARELVVEHLVSARVVNLSDLVRELRLGWRDTTGPSESLVLDRYRAFGWLAIDEVSLHAFRGEPKQHLYDVINHRLEQKRPTILTSNETPAALLDLLGPALVSRINGSGGVVDFGDADYRQRSRAGAA